MEESKKEMEKEIEKGIEKEIEKGVEKGVASVVAFLVGFAVSFVIAVLVFKFMWAWVVGDLFPGAVAEGLISADLSWLAAVKLALPVSVVSGFSTIFGPSKRRMW